MARNSVRGTPYTHIGPASNQGYREGGGASNTVADQYRGSGINTQANSRGTPAQYEHGNPADAQRVASQGPYGMVESNQQGNANSPQNNGSGVLLDGAGGASTMDSPVPGGAPRFDPGFIAKENTAHLGSGNEMGARDLINGGGVMSRGMVQKSTSAGAETELTADDTLPAVGPA